MSVTNVARAGKRGNICVGNNVSSFASTLKLGGGRVYSSVTEVECTFGRGRVYTSVTEVEVKA